MSTSRSERLNTCPPCTKPWTAWKTSRTTRRHIYWSSSAGTKWAGEAEGHATLYRFVSAAYSSVCSCQSASLRSTPRHQRHHRPRRILREVLGASQLALGEGVALPAASGRPHRDRHWPDGAGQVLLPSHLQLHQTGVQKTPGNLLTHIRSSETHTHFNWLCHTPSYSVYSLRSNASKMMKFIGFVWLDSFVLWFCDDNLNCDQFSDYNWSDWTVVWITDYTTLNNWSEAITNMVKHNTTQSSPINCCCFTQWTIPLMYCNTWFFNNYLLLASTDIKPTSSSLLFCP